MRKENTLDYSTTRLLRVGWGVEGTTYLKEVKNGEKRFGAGHCL
jgi:hypothetical protein